MGVLETQLVTIGPELSGRNTLGRIGLKNRSTNATTVRVTTAMRSHRSKYSFRRVLGITADSRRSSESWGCPPPPFAPPGSALVLPQPLWQMTADLPDHRVGVWHRNGNGFLVHHPTAKNAEVLLDRRELRLVSAQPEKQRRLVDVLLHDRRDHLAAPVLEVLAQRQRLDRPDVVVGNRDARQDARDLDAVVEHTHLVALAGQKDPQAKRKLGRDVRDPNRVAGGEQLASVQPERRETEADDQQHPGEE